MVMHDVSPLVTGMQQSGGGKMMTRQTKQRMRMSPHAPSHPFLPARKIGVFLGEAGRLKGTRAL